MIGPYFLGIYYRKHMIYDISLSPIFKYDIYTYRKDICHFRTSRRGKEPPAWYVKLLERLAECHWEDWFGSFGPLNPAHLDDFGTSWSCFLLLFFLFLSFSSCSDSFSDFHNGSSIRGSWGDEAVLRLLDGCPFSPEEFQANAIVFGIDIPQSLLYHLVNKHGYWMEKNINKWVFLNTHVCLSDGAIVLFLSTSLWMEVPQVLYLFAVLFAKNSWWTGSRSSKDVGVVPVDGVWGLDIEPERFIHVRAIGHKPWSRYMLYNVTIY